MLVNYRLIGLQLSQRLISKQIILLINHETNVGPSLGLSLKFFEALFQKYWLYFFAAAVSIPLKFSRLHFTIKSPTNLL